MFGALQRSEAAHSRQQDAEESFGPMGSNGQTPALEATEMLSGDKAEPSAEGDGKAHPSGLPHRTTASPLTAIIGDSENSTVSTSEAAPAVASAVSAADPDEQSIKAQPREETVPFLLVDDNAINLKVGTSTRIS